MDCTKFESAALDEIYGDLDELTRASLKKHEASCDACRALFERLKAAREATRLPRFEAPVGLEQRILDRAFGAGAAATTSSSTATIKANVVKANVVELGAAARKSEVNRDEARGNFGRWVSRAGSWAMRPQTAMAAVFLLMMGSSVLLLQGKSRPRQEADMTVTVVGEPSLETQGAASAARPVSGEELAKAHGAPKVAPVATSIPGMFDDKRELPLAEGAATTRTLGSGGKGSVDRYPTEKEPSNAGDIAGQTEASRPAKKMAADGFGSNSYDPVSPPAAARAGSKAMQPKPSAVTKGESDPCADYSRRLAALQTAQAANSQAIAEATKELESCRALAKEREAKRARASDQNGTY